MRGIVAAVPELLMLAGVIMAIVPLWTQKPSGQSNYRRTKLEAVDGREMNDCGPASLYVVCKWNDRPHSLSELRILAKTSVLGTDMLSLKEAATQLGFEVEACKCSFSDLLEHVSQTKRSAILHSPKLHYVPVVCAAGDQQVRLVDGNIGVHDMTATDLAKVLEWDGAVLLLTAK